MDISTPQSTSSNSRSRTTSSNKQQSQKPPGREKQLKDLDTRSQLVKEELDYLHKEEALLLLAIDEVEGRLAEMNCAADLPMSTLMSVESSYLTRFAWLHEPVERYNP